MTNRAEFERLLDVYGFRCERFGQDLSTHARAQVVSAFAALASAPVADEREPLPCPFCGGRAFATYKTDEDDIRWHSVHCRTECRGYGKHGSEKDAIAAWNTRTTLLRKYPNDEEIIDLAVEPLGIDCDRMPHGVVVFARNLLSRYAAPQASEAKNYPGDDVAERLDNMADDQPPGSQAQSDLYAAATIWRKHIAHRAAPQASEEEQAIIAAFLERSGQWLTNDATVKAARDAAFETVRKQLCKLPRYSFFASAGTLGGVRRVEDRSGNWIEFDAAHALFDPTSVDAALSAQPGAQATSNDGGE